MRKDEKKDTAKSLKHDVGIQTCRTFFSHSSRMLFFGDRARIYPNSPTNSLRHTKKKYDLFSKDEQTNANMGWFPFSSFWMRKMWAKGGQEAAKER